MKSFSGPGPIYRQIADSIKDQIVARTLTDGDKLMSTTEYAATYRINPATAQKAFAELTRQGLVEKRWGIGMFVASGACKKLVGNLRTGYQDEVLLPALERGRELGYSDSQLLDLIRTYLGGKK
ncbi:MULTISPECIES: GntR family transcriptional regulator [unclassified Winkia]|uniref:GntR family transcriptional regulator n=1 Tax=unclassified Winkia TaxID=2692119 RepID=UPI002554A887|nr:MULTISPECIES: GntR family transcriptional regulator [unclassified Winkia]MDK7163441.1 GntR family transcriptional regulator [Winkia sp. UMB3105]MDK7905618.1 GntR family transcriptional regulator [Winkia sp. UMB0889B]MDK8594996.1 GntR family transcriptional regulator [Winkia sp. UMB1096A]MDU2268317.1 GntR family transcriptional regulator [Winkia neuii]